ncbi:MAG: PAS domain S-box protein [Betaproteobacteria bacterium]|nr:PAS domain S-box protein [Betaproteobacteria bacterium]MDH5577463.1 PAS domain S-box protein [Betaproteobacteria bacterium]
MTVAERLRVGATRPEVAPALFRLLAEAALSRAALDACGVPVALADAAGSRPLSYVNQSFEAFFGFRAAEALGRPAHVLLAMDPALAEQLYREPASSVVLHAQRKDCALAHVEVAVGAVRGSDGRVTHWVLAFSDRTELEQLRSRLSRPST